MEESNFLCIFANIINWRVKWGQQIPQVVSRIISRSRTGLGSQGDRLCTFGPLGPPIPQTWALRLRYHCESTEVTPNWPPLKADRMPFPTYKPRGLNPKPRNEEVVLNHLWGSLNPGPKVPSPFPPGWLKSSPTTPLSVHRPQHSWVSHGDCLMLIQGWGNRCTNHICVCIYKYIYIYMWFSIASSTFCIISLLWFEVWVSHSIVCLGRVLASNIRCVSLESTSMSFMTLRDESEMRTFGFWISYSSHSYGPHHRAPQCHLGIHVTAPAASVRDCQVDNYRLAYRRLFGKDIPVQEQYHSCIDSFLRVVKIVFFFKSSEYTVAFIWGRAMKKNCNTLWCLHDSSKSCCRSSTFLHRSTVEGMTLLTDKKLVPREPKYGIQIRCHWATVPVLNEYRCTETHIWRFVSLLNTDNTVIIRESRKAYDESSWKHHQLVFTGFLECRYVP